MAGDLALASYHDLKGKMIMQVNMKKGNGIALLPIGVFLVLYRYGNL